MDKYVKSIGLPVIKRNEEKKLKLEKEKLEREKLELEKELALVLEKEKKKKKKKRKRNRVPDKVRDDCYRYVEGGFTKEMKCPGCLMATIEFKKYNGWHASHIRPSSKGGAHELWNLYPLCANCNGDMGDKNMFCYFYYTDIIIIRMIRNIHQLIRLAYPAIYKICKGQFYRIAQKLYAEKIPNDGGIPQDHLIWKMFLEYDLTENTKILYNIKNELQVFEQLYNSVEKQYKYKYKYEYGYL